MRSGFDGPVVLKATATQIEFDLRHRGRLKKALSIAFVPYWGSGNPYQDALAEHLVAHGATVRKVRSLKELFRYGVCVDRDVDVVHLHWLLVFRWRGLRALRCLAFVIRLLLLRMHGVRLVWTIHNLLPHESRHPKLDWLLRRIVAGLSHAMIVHSETAKRQAMDMWRLKDASRVTVVPHGHYMDDYRNDVSRQEARQRLSVDGSKIVLLFLGAVRPYKGILDLVEAFKKLADDDAYLVIAGKPLDHAFAERIGRAISDVEQVRFDAGFVDDDDVQVYMNASDVVILPYRHVLSSGAALLAMSFGKPCIAPAEGSLADVLDTSGAFLYDPECEEGLLDAIQRALGAKDALIRMGEHNRQRASQWTWDNAARMTLAVYERFLAGNGGGAAAGHNTATSERIPRS